MGYYKLLLLALSHGCFWLGIIWLIGTVFAVKSGSEKRLEGRNDCRPLDALAIHEAALLIGLFAASAIAKLLSM